MTKNVDYKIIKEIAVLSESKTVTKRLNVVQWGGRDPKLDVRIWRQNDNGETVPQKGVTLTVAEAEALEDALRSYLSGGKEDTEW